MEEFESLSRKKLNVQLESRIPIDAWKATVSIVIVRGRELQQFGTGTLVSIAEQSFVVTAAHVIKAAQKYSSSLCLASEGGSFVQIQGNWLCSVEGQYGTSSDPFDVALLSLDPGTVVKLSGNTFLRLDDIDFDEDQTTGIFCLCGFPALWSQPSTDAEPTMSVKPLQYVTHAFTGSTESLSEYQGRFHLLLNAEPIENTDIEGDQLVFKGRGGARASFPSDLGGISGCSVWKIGDRRVPLSEWARLRPKVVGVQTGVYPGSQIIKATQWVAVSTLFYEALPDLRPAMLLWRTE